MTSIKLIVTGASARAEVDGLLTSGMVGIPVTITYDSAWDGLTKALVCRGGSVIRTILNVDGTATVPHECMIANATLQIGVEGRNADGTLVIPTVWARCGLICSGANAEADPSTDPTLPVWAQIQAMIGNLTESDPTVPAWAKQPEKPSYTASEVGADPSGTAAAQVAAHNTGTDTHSDIRLLIQGLTDRLNALADSDDTMLDQLSEVVSYIKSNRSLIEAITTSKVSVADIIDNLTTNVANKPLSAAQGVVIKTLIDALHNDKLDAAELTNAVNIALAQAKASGEFDGADGKSAYQYAQEGGYTGTETEFAAKLAEEIPTALPNPNALTFTGAVEGSYDGSAPVTVEIPRGGGVSGGSGKAKTQILIDQKITELTASLSVTLEHDFHNLTAIINCGSAGAALTADSDGNAVASKIGLLIGTTSFTYNQRKVAYIDTSTGAWKTMMFGAEWADDLSVFKQGFAVEIDTGIGNKYYASPFGGTGAMSGTLGPDDNAPRTGKTANIVVNGAYLNVGTRVVLWGEYYE